MGCLGRKSLHRFVSVRKRPQNAYRSMFSSLVGYPHGYAWYPWCGPDPVLFLQFGRLVPMTHMPSDRFSGTNYQKQTVRVGLGSGLVCHYEKNFFSSSFKVSDIKATSWNQTLLSALWTDITIQLGYQRSWPIDPCVYMGTHGRRFR